MTTTESLRVYPDFFKTEKECTEAEEVRKQTNPLYKGFNQTHFTAGDPEQFEEYRNPKGSVTFGNVISLGNNVFSDIKLSDTVYFEKYRDLTVESVRNTFEYLFHKFKKGIFVKIVDNILEVFLPFSKKEFRNEWSHKIKIDPKYRDLSGFIEHIQTANSRKFDPNRVNKYIDGWYANNCLLRYEFPVSEGDTGNGAVSDMFTTLCKDRELPSIEFFVNRRDFPIIKKDGTEPYFHIFDSHEEKLLSHNYEKYCPILSMVTREGYADIPIPTPEDWARVCRADNKFFTKLCKRDFSVKKTEWKDRKNIAIFRGSSTGCGVTPETNPRLNLAKISAQKPTHNGNLILDAGITAWNPRPRKLYKEPYLQTINIKRMKDEHGIEIASFMSPEKQSEYKYAVNVDGHVSAFRLAMEFSSEMCVLLVDSPYKMWYHPYLIDGEHYIGVKSDLSNLREKIIWCIENDEKCEEIAKNGRKFAEKYLSKKGVLDYLQRLLIDLKLNVGDYFYPYSNFFQDMLNFEKREAQRKIFVPDVKISEESIVLSKRSFESLKTIEWYLNGFDFKFRSDPEKVFESEKTRVRKWRIGKNRDIQIVEKKSLLSKNYNEFVHESYISRTTNKFLQISPNFRYIFGSIIGDKNIKIFSEYIDGISLVQFIDKNYNLPDLLSIFLQMALSLEIVQFLYNFVHEDLYTWNSLITQRDTPTKIKYVVNGKVYVIETKIVPIIIDYGKSHVMTENGHSGYINPFSNNRSKDIFTLLISTVNMIIKKSGTEKEASTLLNFLHERKIIGEKVKPVSGHIRYTLAQYKNISEFTTRDLGFTAFDFAEYIIKNFDTSKFLHIEGKTGIQPVFSPLQLYESYSNIPLSVKNLCGCIRNMISKTEFQDPFSLFHVICTFMPILLTADHVFKKNLGDSASLIGKTLSYLKNIHKGLITKIRGKNLGHSFKFEGDGEIEFRKSDLYDLVKISELLKTWPHLLSISLKNQIFLREIYRFVSVLGVTDISCKIEEYTVTFNGKKYLGNVLGIIQNLRNIIGNIGFTEDQLMYTSYNKYTEAILEKLREPIVD